MKNNLCVKCDGRGFHWRKSNIINRDDGSIIAHTYQQGETCEDCGGYGHCGLPVMAWFMFGLAGLVLSAFVIMPLIKLWLD